MTAGPSPLGIYRDILGTLRHRGERPCSVSVVLEANARGHAALAHDILRCHERLTLAGGDDLTEARRMIRAGFSRVDILDVLAGRNIDDVAEFLEMKLGVYPTLENVRLHLESKGYPRAYATRIAKVIRRRMSRPPA
jgi:hypothetical protein